MNWYCPNCKCTTYAVITYKCDNCGEVRCGVCCSEGAECECSYEVEVGDDDFESRNGHYRHYSKLRYKSECEEEEERLEKLKKERLAQEEKRVLYEELIRIIPDQIFVLLGPKNPKKYSCGFLCSDELYYNRDKLSLDDIELIDLHYACDRGTEFDCSFGRGYMQMKDGKKIPVTPYRKKGWFQDTTYFDFSGKITLDPWFGNEKVSIDVNEIVYLKREVLSMKAIGLFSWEDLKLLTRIREKR